MRFGDLDLDLDLDLDGYQPVQLRIMDNTSANYAAVSVRC